MSLKCMAVGLTLEVFPNTQYFASACICCILRTLPSTKTFYPQEFREWGWFGFLTHYK